MRPSSCGLSTMPKLIRRLMSCCKLSGAAALCLCAGVFESWLHPSRYRTQLCKDTQKCNRVVCFFAHSLEELRTPGNSFVPGPEERLRVPEPMQVRLDPLGHDLK